MMKIFGKVKKIFEIFVVHCINIYFNITHRLKSNQVLFLSDVRDTLGGNLKVMYDYLDSDYYKKIVSLKADRRVKRSIGEKLKLIKLLSTSKYILLDDFSNSISMMIPRKNQEIVQLWHGPGAFKKMGYSRPDKKSGMLSKYASHRNYTKAIVTSPSIKWCFEEGFGMEKKGVVSATGFPRCDCFFDQDYIKKVKTRFYREYPELKGKKIILFAPTYRGTNLKVANYEFDKLDLDLLYKKLSKDYVFVFKWHPAIYNNMQLNILERYDFSKYGDFYWDLSKYRDINDLLIVSDILVTDYSSVIFDYVLLDKPVVYFTYDLEEYENDRGLYYPFNDYVYGSVAKNSLELATSIKKAKMMRKERKEFKDKFMSSCDGNSTKKTYEFIFKDKE